MQTFSTKDDVNSDVMKDYASSSNPHMGSDVRLTDVASKAASDVAAKAKQTARSLVDEGKHAATEGFYATSRWVNDTTAAHPMRTLGIAAGVGLVIGMLIARR